MDVEKFISKYWGKPGGAERATYQMFLTELAQVLGASTPDPGAGGELGNYQFEGPVKSEAVFLSKHNKRIDLYKRNHFILEAKQSQLKPGETLPAEPPEEPLEPVYDLFGNIVGHAEPKGRKKPRYDRLMADARVQAERYSLALPSGHKPPPFLIVADIGRAFEFYFDWTGDGRGYGFFPDQQNYRLLLTSLANDEVIGSTGLTAQDLLRAIWLDPESVDPRKKAVAVTRDIAERLSRVAAQLEADEKALRNDRADFEIALGIEKTSLFLMRVLFCMFAEDVELLPKGSFTQFLDESRGKSDQWWRAGLHDLWAKMNAADEQNRFWPYGDAIVRYFNGNLFSSANVYDLPQEFRGELFEAAKRDWRSVEPAIFGTLLEQVLTTEDRAKLGAHYTPRPYVQRLVNATIGDVLYPEWNATRDEARRLEEAGDHISAVAAIRAFHQRLCELTVLDPACGTGNFLYVSMELLLQLESEAIQLATELGESIAPAIHPNQLLGLELNPRAAVIAELVLWIGWLRHRLANQPEAITDPVLPTLTNINFGTHGGYDAVLRRNEHGEPDIFRPSAPNWPSADFIVGNPPFIGGKGIRGSLGSDYAEALWRANSRVPKSADFVMHWWDRAAQLLVADKSRLRRFGFVTTNSITQIFSRRVIESYLSNDSLSIVYAIPDHPWTKATRDAAAVRIAMTVAERGAHIGTLLSLETATDLDTDSPQIEYSEDKGLINARLRLDTLPDPIRLSSNISARARGVEFHAEGYVLSASEYAHICNENPEFYKKYVHRYKSLDDYKKTDKGRYVADLYGISEKELRQSAHLLYERLLRLAYPKRKENDVLYRRENWWMLALPHIELRDGINHSERYIVRGMTTKYSWFTSELKGVVPDQGLIAIFLPSYWHLGVLSSNIHEEWFIEYCGWLGAGNDPRYNPRSVFDPFPFPEPSEKQKEKIGELAEELDATRKLVLAQVPRLTMTELYGLRDLVRSGEATPAQSERARQARAAVIDRLHQQIDAAVAEAYGWPMSLAPAEIVARLVALNTERAAEEATGTVRWLNPGYQIPRSTS